MTKHSYNTALVTGASNGIGEHLARRLAALGTDVVLVARREEKLQALAADLRLSYPARRVEVLACDLSEAGSGQKVENFLSTQGLTVDLLVNNAGVGSHEAFTAEDRTALARQIQLNCATLVDLTSRLLPPMLAANHGKGDGAVINVASTAAFQPVPIMAVYGATKAFVLSFTEALSEETRKTGVRVLALCPGATNTDFFTTTGKEFLTKGRQTPDAVAAIALKALDGGKTVVISGTANRLKASGYRFLPRTMLTRLSGRIVAAA